MERVTWKSEDDFSGILRVVRLGYPNMIAGKIMSVQPMTAPSNSIFYIKPVKDKDDTH